MAKQTSKRTKVGNRKRTVKPQRRIAKPATRLKKTGQTVARSSREGTVERRSTHRATATETEPGAESFELMEVELVNDPEDVMEAEEPELSLLPTSLEN